MNARDLRYHVVTRDPPLGPVPGDGDPGSRTLTMTVDGRLSYGMARNAVRILREIPTPQIAEFRRPQLAPIVYFFKLVFRARLLSIRLNYF